MVPFSDNNCAALLRRGFDSSKEKYNAREILINIDFRLTLSWFVNIDTASVGESGHVDQPLDLFGSEDTPERAAERKQNHIDICRSENIESRAAAWDDFVLEPEALPEFSPNDVRTLQSFLGHQFSLPFLITGMTGGVRDGQRINEVLAVAAEKFNIPMGLGSQKLMLKDNSYRELFDVRKKAPRVFLIGNIGAVSFNYGVTTDQIASLVESLELNAFAVHLNVLQELIQPEGERDFSGLLPFIEKLVRQLPVPVIVKEVGSGMSAKTCRRLFDVGVSAVDVGGNGGTSWSVIEGIRGNHLTRRLGELFRNWGYSTLDSVRQCASLKGSSADLHQRALIGTGGVRNGHQAALLLASGADMCGIGLPLFRAVMNPRDSLSPEEALHEELEFFTRSLKIAMYCCGAQRISDLRARIQPRSDV